MVSAPGGSRKRLFVGIGIAIVALLALATTALAAGIGGHRNAPNAGVAGSNNGGHMFGPRALVTAVDTTKNTITLGGVPQQWATITVDSNIKLAALQPDGTTKDAVIGDFKQGSVVQVGVKFNGRPGRGNGQPGNGQQPAPGSGSPSAAAPANGQGKPNVTVTQLTLVPAGTVRTSGLVTSISGGTIQIIDSGGLQLTVNAASAKVTKGQNTAAALTDIKVGDRIMVDGTQAAGSTTVNATTLRLFDPSMMRPGSQTGTEDIFATT